MRPFRRVPWFLGLLLFSACERGKAPPPVDSAPPPVVSPADSAVAATTRNWDTNAGPVLLVSGGSPTQALIVTPDSASAAAQLASLPSPASVTLFGRNGTVQTAELPSITEANGCAAGSLSGAPPPRPWNVGFIGGVIAPVAMDSTESISPADSAQLVVAVTRLASVLPNDSAGRFEGLPFDVKALWRFSIAERTVVIATLSRQINQEATPLQEHTLIVAERPASDTTLTTSYSERSYGEEETVESYDVLAGALIGADRTPAVILSRDYGDATAFGLLERNDDGRWRPRWRSARRHC